MAYKSEKESGILVNDSTFSSSKMCSLDTLFIKNIFRIPDYQRGYSWKNDELDDFWQDLLNLQPNRQHYTGMLTVESVANNQYKNWKNENWIIKNKGYTPYFIVDGQQRITTIIILIQNLVEYLEKNEKYLGLTRQEIIEKYLYIKTKNKNIVGYLFGYEIRDPSDEYLKNKIFRQDSLSGSKPDTSYTNNLGDCYKFFDKRNRDFFHEQREIIFRKVTQQLMFDIKPISKELDIFVVFETMNNHGKELTNLEKLKNRLIYLSTLMPGLKNQEQESLRNEINTVWKFCYEHLGKDKRKPLDDDTFLRNHFVLYHFFNKEKGYPYHQLFKEIYTVKNVVSNSTFTSYKEIQIYISSLHKAARQWYIINNPEHAFINGIISDIQERDWLVKINRLGLRIFGPLTLAVYLKTENPKDRIRYLKSIEAYIFLIYLCAGRKSTLGNAYFSNIAMYLYNDKDEWTLDKVNEEVHKRTYGDDSEYYDYSPDRFIANIKDQFVGSKSDGYYNWPGVRYFLFEYDNYLRGREESKVKWTMPNSIEHIYPQTPSDISWKKSFIGFTPKQQRYLCNSLGNLVLLSHSKNSSLSNKPFDKKKKTIHSTGSSSGFFNGSHSEINVAESKNWNPREIYNRGVRMLTFLIDYWEIDLTKKEIKELFS